MCKELKSSITIEELCANLGEDQDFVKVICEAESAEQVKKLFSQKNVEMDDESAEAFFHRVHATDSDELSEEDLANASGGFCTLAVIGAWAIVGAAGGIVAAGCLLALYVAYKKASK